MTHADSGQEADIESAILAFVNDPTDGSRRALAATGAAGLSRMIRHWYMHDPIPGLPVTGGARWLADLLSEALAIVAVAEPDQFVRFVEGRRLGTMELSVLGDVRSAGAIRLLCAYVHADDFLLRYGAVRSLIRSGATQARPCIEAALTDDVPTVQAIAIKGVSRWDPARAISLYEAFLCSDQLTPLNRQAASWAIGELRAGREVRDALDPL